MPSTMNSPKLDKRARLVYCKSHVAIHPTTFNKDNLSGYLGLVEVEASDAPRVDTDSDGNVRSTLPGKKEMLVTWVPNELLERMDEADRQGYKRVATEFSHGPPKDNEDEGESGVKLVKITADGRFCVRIDTSSKGREICFLRISALIV